MSSLLINWSSVNDMDEGIRSLVISAFYNYTTEKSLDGKIKIYGKCKKCLRIFIGNWLPRRSVKSFYSHAESCSPINYTKLTRLLKKNDGEKRCQEIAATQPVDKWLQTNPIVGNQNTETTANHTIDDVQSVAAVTENDALEDVVPDHHKIPNKYFIETDFQKMTTFINEFLREPVSVSCQCDIWTTSPVSGTPKILKTSLNQCTVRGGEEMLIIGKNFSKDANVYFEEIIDDQVVWSRAADMDKLFSEPTHLVCTVPPYVSLDVKSQVDVLVVVDASDPVPFTYMPCQTSKPTFLSHSADIPNEADGYQTTYPGHVSPISEDSSQLPDTITSAETANPADDASQLIIPQPQPIVIIPMELLTQQDSISYNPNYNTFLRNSNQEYPHQCRQQVSDKLQSFSQQYSNINYVERSENSGRHFERTMFSTTDFNNPPPLPQLERIQNIQSLMPSTGTSAGIPNQNVVRRNRRAQKTLCQNNLHQSRLIAGSSQSWHRGSVIDSFGNFLSSRYLTQNYRPIRHAEDTRTVENVSLTHVNSQRQFRYPVTNPSDYTSDRTLPTCLRDLEEDISPLENIQPPFF